jgi:outer membrane protein assembly factor BamB
VLIGSSQGDLFELTPDAFSQVTHQPLVRGTTVSQNLRFDYSVPLENGDRVYGGVGESERILNYQAKDLMNNRLSLVAPPADRVGAEPIGFQNTLLVPSSQGLICRLDPNTGGVVGAPFQPPTNPNNPFQWVSPAVVGSDRFLAGTTRGSLFLVRAEQNASLVKEAELEYPALIVSPLRARGAIAYAVCRDASGDKLVAFSTEGAIAEAKSVVLKSEYVGHLTCLESAILLETADGNVQCFDGDLNLKWSYASPQTDGLVAKIAGRIGSFEDSLLIAYQSGDVTRLDTTTGEVRGTTNLELPVAGPPAPLDGTWYIADQHGIVHIMNPL